MKRHRKHAWFSPLLSLESTKILDFQLKGLLNRLNCQSKSTKNCFWAFVRPLSCPPDCSKGISAARSGGGFLTKKRSRLTLFKKQCLSPPYSFFWAVSGAGGVFAVASPPGRRRRAPRPLGNARIISTRVESRLLQTSSKLEKKEEVEVKGEKKKFFLPRVCVDVLDFFPPPNHSPPPHFAIWKFLRHRPEKGEGGGKEEKWCVDMGTTWGLPPATKGSVLCLWSFSPSMRRLKRWYMVEGGSTTQTVRKKVGREEEGRANGQLTIMPLLPQQ